MSRRISPVAPGSVRLRAVKPKDFEQFLADQADPESAALAVVPTRSRFDFARHWATISADPEVVLRTITVNGAVAGNALSFVKDGERHIGYRVSRAHWGRGIASAALPLLLDEISERPLVATVAQHNAGSIRVLEKSGFKRVCTEAWEDGITGVIYRLS